MSRHMDVFRSLASKDEFPTLKEIDSLIQAAEDVSNEAVAQAASQRLLSLREQIMNGTPGEATTFVPVLLDIEKAASKCFKAYQGMMGTWDSEYKEKLAIYQGDVVGLLRSKWLSRSGGGRASEEVAWLDNVVARTRLWLMPIPDVHIPMPLMTGTIMDKAWASLEAVKEGYKEVSMEVPFYRNIF
jgi:hypothetical protein